MAGIPQVITSDRASGAQVIDGSLGFSGTDQKLERTPGSAGNLQTWTWSGWVKHNPGQENSLFSSHTGASDRLHLRTGNGGLQFAQNTGSWDFDIRSNALFRDNGWYHIVAIADFTNSTQNDRARLYVNGERQTLGTNTLPSNTTTNTIVNAVKAHYIGEARSSTDFDGRMSQVYLIDGQALGPEYFGFTDPLTNTWKPKKYENTTASHGDAAGVVGFGTNGFYLPMDGNSPIGQDKSGQGNDWTPVNFGSVALDNPQVSGARPILNTTQGGTVSGVGVFGSKQNVGYAVTVYDDGGGNKYYIDGVKQATLTGLIRGATYTFDTSDSTVGSTHPFRFAASDGGSQYSNGVAAITGAATTITIPYNSSNELYYYCTSHSGMGSSITGITTNEKLADQYASHCTLALPLVGSTNDTCASIACTSRNKTATSSGPVGVSTESNFYSGSYYYGAASNTLQYAEQGDELVFGTGDFTIECWVYDDNGHNGGGSGRCYIFDNRIGGSETGDPPTMVGYVDSHNEFNFYDGDSTITFTVGSTVGKWWHYAVTREGTTTKMFIDGIEVGSSTSSTNFTNNGIGVGRATDGGYGWAGYIQDFRAYKGIAKYTSDFVVPATSPNILPDTPSGVSGGSKLAKITDGSVAFDGTNDSVSIADHADFTFGSGDFTLEAYAYLDYATGYRSLAQKYGGSPSTSSWFWSFNDGQQVFYYYSGSNEPNMTSPIKQYNRWVHCAVAREGNTIRMFDDGKLTGTLDVSSYTSMNDSTVPVDIGADYADNYDFNGFISNVRIVKGTALYTKNFTPPTAPLTNVTNTKLLCCQSPTSAIEAAVSPSTPSVVNDAVATNFNPFNTDINTVRGQETGYPTLNPLSVSGRSSNRTSSTLSNGNLTSTNPGSNAWNCRIATVGVDSGKWFYEYTIDGSISNFLGGWADPPNLNFGDAVGNTSRSYGYYSTGNVRNSNNNTSFGASYTAGDVIGCAIDLDSYKIYWSKNGVWQNGAVPAAGTGSIYTVTSGYQYFPAVSTYDSSSSVTVNFGQKPFKFPPPDGFQPLSAANTRPETVITRPDQYVGIVTYVSDSSDITVSSLNHQPDFLWIKSFNNSGSHTLTDSVRGPTFSLKTDSTDNQEERTGSNSKVKSFDINGFTLGTNSDVNSNGDSSEYVVWTWKAGGAPTADNTQTSGAMTANSVSLDGVLQSAYTPSGSPSTYPKRMSIGTKQGFSIVQYVGNATNRTIPHGMGKPAKFMIIKNMDTDATGWAVYHDAIGHTETNNYIELSNGSAGQDDTAFQDTAPTSDVFSVGTKAATNNDTDNTIAYIWADVPGLQKFGQFEGNGNADGPFIELGFRPALLFLKCVDNSGTNYDWRIIDAERQKINDSTGSRFLIPYSQDNQAYNSTIDFLSNGFKIRSSTGEVNEGSHTFVYAAWAEAPSIDLFGGGANAR